MKARVISVSGYRYNDKVTGLLKEGMSMTIQNIESVVEDDGRGNFTYGFPVEEVRLSVPFIMSQSELVALIDHNVEIIKDRRVGARYDTVTEIRLLE